MMESGTTVSFLIAKVSLVTFFFGSGGGDADVLLDTVLTRRRGADNNK